MTALSIFMRHNFYFVLFYFYFELRGATMLVFFFFSNSEEQKRLNRDVIDTFATHAYLVRDATCTECKTQNGSAHGCFRPAVDSLNQ